VRGVDLTVALKADSPHDDKVIKAIEKVCKAGQESGKTIGMFVPDDNEAKKWMAQGATLFLLSSDHSFIINGANRLIATLKS